MSKATAFAPPLIAFLLGCSALSAPAQAGWFDSDSKPAAPVPKKDDKPAPAPAVTLDDSIREAQMLRLAGNYKEALNHLSQLMLVATDDATVISEYGKTLVSMGRADEAEKFLTRAQELQSNDWTIYSALGVANDEIGNQKDAQASYERALALRPDEPSVLNNYALSRMLAKDPFMARKLADRAETANAAAKDEEITRNIAMIRSMAPEAGANVAANSAAPGTIVPAVTAPLTHATVTTAPLAPVKAETASAAPRGVVMQPVPVDPLAGPVGPRTAVATHEPRSLQSKVPAEAAVNLAVKADAPKADLPKADLAKAAQAARPVPAPAKPQAIATVANKPGAPAKPISPAPKPEAVARAKPVPAVQKPAAVAQAKPVAPARKPEATATAANKPAAAAAKVTLPVKAADVKPIAQPSVVKAADAKPQDAKAKAASKDTIPGLRMSANAY